MQAAHNDDLRDQEDAPFLPGEQGSSAPPRYNDRAANAAREKLRWRLIITLFAMILTVETGNAMVSGPTTRIYEAIACRDYYQAHDPSKIGNGGQIPEELCKNSEIQSEVAIVKGYGELFDGLTSIFLAIPYGLLADRMGRKPTILLSIPGFILNMVSTLVVLWFSNVFPLRAVWFSSLAWLLGGGLVVAAALVWTMMADVTTDAQRATMFFQFGVAVMGSEFISSMISSWLMQLNPWIPMLLGWGIMLGGIFAALSLPETKNAFPTSANEMSDFNRQEDEDEVEAPRNYGRLFGRNTLLRRSWARVKSIVAPYSFITADKQVLLLLSAFLVYKLSRGTSWFLVQYVSLRYGWTIARANLLTSLKSILTVVLFVAGLPAVSWYLMKYRGVDSRQKDLILTKSSIVCLLVGTLGIGLSPTAPLMITCLVIQTLGQGFVYATRSIITTMIQRDQTARLYTIIEIIQALGMILASPIITAFFQWGLKLGGFWVGLAWMVGTILFVIVAWAIWSVKLPYVPKTTLDSEEE
ncbi:hypothetical protein DTO166G4_6474 [Paecilomyces variotii]|nr:hypothetical protein DTO166G4_6474 [Paecilomyces variotii]KAJ9219993.1 hypothetical protein DTO169C6_7650 [Paecilomyces variotii]KAJ9231961.1 hypothetical protein DTO166G5_6492 [Paecilomyces variotii]KAJ9251640.1 hypothetical protein DTO207G8_5320 [Paecilomyces variotii]KAJ9265984.1 hypothetical protein DTO212C5_6545 [Paecilomyces variotii]